MSSSGRPSFPLLRALFKASDAPIRPGPLAFTPELGRALLVALGMAVLWWAVGQWVAGVLGNTVWYDQRVTFTQAAGYVNDPYSLRNFVNAPWTIVALVPLGWLPLEPTVFIQCLLTFGLLTLVIFRFGGNQFTVISTCISYIAFQTTLEMSIDWLTYIGLLVPPALSGIFLLMKPQTALGVWLSFARRDFAWALIIGLSLIVASFVIWSAYWPLRAWQSISTLSLGQFYNLAPQALMPWPIAVGIGLVLAWWAFRRRDPILSILAWMFFIPYIAPVSLLLPFALVNVRWPRLGLLLNALISLIYGGVVVAGVVAALA